LFLMAASAQNQSTVRIGDLAPDFTSPSTVGEFNLHKYLGSSWGIFFSHPADFTPVCTTELGAVQRLLPEFEKRNVKVFAVSVDDVDSHHKWVKDINETQNVISSTPLLPMTNERSQSCMVCWIKQT